MGESLSPVGAYRGAVLLTLCLCFREQGVGMRAAGSHNVSLKIVLAMGCLLLVGFSGAASAGEMPQKLDLTSFRNKSFSRAAGGGRSQGVSQVGSSLNMLVSGKPHHAPSSLRK